MKALVTGCDGLIGSESVAHFGEEGHEIIGVDNNMCREFFGPLGDVTWSLERLVREARNFT